MPKLHWTDAEKKKMSDKMKARWAVKTDSVPPALTNNGTSPLAALQKAFEQARQRTRLIDTEIEAMQKEKASLLEFLPEGREVHK